MKMEYKYKKPRIHNGELRTPVTFYEYAPHAGPEPGEVEKSELFTTFAKVDSVWTRDLTQAKATGVMSDVTLFIRETHGEYIPDTKHYLSIEMPEYKNKRYQIKDVAPEPQLRDFVRIVAEVVN